MNLIASFILAIAVIQGPFQCGGPRVTSMCALPAPRMANPALCVSELFTFYRGDGYTEQRIGEPKCHFAIPQPIPQKLQSEYNRPKTF